MCFDHIPPTALSNPLTLPADPLRDKPSPTCLSFVSMCPTAVN